LLDRLTNLQVATVAAHGGDVFALAGDAVLAVWLADEVKGDAALSLAVARAAACALDMHAGLASEALEAELGTPLRLRVGIGAGRVLLATTGAAGQHCEAYVAGKPMEQVALAERQARVGEVVLSAEAAAAANDLLDMQAGPEKDANG
jgi:class 3 adenylate cyclase